MGGLVRTWKWHVAQAPTFLDPLSIDWSLTWSEVLDLHALLLTSPWLQLYSFSCLPDSWNMLLPPLLHHYSNLNHCTWRGVFARHNHIFPCQLCLFPVFLMPDGWSFPWRSLDCALLESLESPQPFLQLNWVSLPWKKLTWLWLLPWILLSSYNRDEFLSSFESQVSPMLCL